MTDGEILDLADRWGPMDDFGRFVFIPEHMLDFAYAIKKKMEDKHILEISQLEYEIRLVRARNQRLQEEMAWLESVGRDVVRDTVQTRRNNESDH